MPLLNGMDAGQELKRRLPHAKLIVLTMNEDFDLATAALRSWASGYLLKKSAATELLKAIRQLLQGLSYVTPKVAQHLLQEWIRDPTPDREKHLTPRQREVVQLVVEGRSLKEIASILRTTARTVAFHKYRVMEEFGIKTNLDLIKFAIREGIVIDGLAPARRAG
jgi:DNA-binding NarL/FixJ family response regulator